MHDHDTRSSSYVIIFILLLLLPLLFLVVPALPAFIPYSLASSSIQWKVVIIWFSRWLHLLSHIENPKGIVSQNARLFQRPSEEMQGKRHSKTTGASDGKFCQSCTLFVHQHFHSLVELPLTPNYHSSATLQDLQGFSDLTSSCCSTFSSRE